MRKSWQTVAEQQGGSRGGWESGIYGGTFLLWVWDLSVGAKIITIWKAPGLPARQAIAARVLSLWGLVLAFVL